MVCHLPRHAATRSGAELSRHGAHGALGAMLDLHSCPTVYRLRSLWEGHGEVDSSLCDDWDLVFPPRTVKNTNLLDASLTLVSRLSCPFNLFDRSLPSRHSANPDPLLSSFSENESCTQSFLARGNRSWHFACCTTALTFSPALDI